MGDLVAITPLQFVHVVDLVCHLKYYDFFLIFKCCHEDKYTCMYIVHDHVCVVDLDI